MQAKAIRSDGGRLLLAIGCLALLAQAGCYAGHCCHRYYQGPLAARAPLQPIPAVAAAGSAENGPSGSGCSDASRCNPHCVGHGYLLRHLAAGRFGRNADQGPAVIQPPHPRFIPVPTQPVFTSRPEYPPPGGHTQGFVPAPSQPMEPKPKPRPARPGKRASVNTPLSKYLS